MLTGKKLVDTLTAELGATLPLWVHRVGPTLCLVQFLVYGVDTIVKVSLL